MAVGRAMPRRQGRSSSSTGTVLESFCSAPERSSGRVKTRSVARAYRITSSLEVFLSSYMLVFAHLLLLQRHSTRRTTQGTRPQTSDV